MTTTPINLEELRQELIQKDPQEEKDPLVEKQRRSRQFQQFDDNILKAEVKALRADIGESGSFLAEALLKRSGAPASTQEEQESEKLLLQEQAVKKTRLRAIEAELKRRAPPDMLARQVQGIKGAVKVELAKPFAPIKVRKERSEKVRGTGKQIEGWFQTETSPEGQILEAPEQNGEPEAGTQEPSKKEPSQLGVSLEDMSAGGFAAGVGLVGAFDNSDLKSSNVQFTPYPEPVSIQGGLSILGTLQDEKGVSGFRVVWNAETIDWSPDEKDSGFGFTL